MLAKRLGELYTKYVTNRKTTSSQRRQEALEQTILKNRKETLRFRDVGLEQDVVRLDRDFLMALRLLRYGTDYTLDIALERRLNYRQVHALSELTRNHGKLLEGTPRLLPRGIPMPLLNGLHRFGSKRAYGTDPSVSLSFRSFSRPTIIHLVHPAMLGEKHALKWKELVPSEGVDTVVLYNFHLFSVQMMQRFVVKSLRNRLPAPCENCYYGKKLIPAFMPTFDIRNFCLNYVMLADHYGHVRWMSGAFPNEREKSLLPALCAQLKEEFLKRPRD